MAGRPKKPKNNKTITVLTKHNPMIMKDLGITGPKSSEKIIRPIGLRDKANRVNLGLIEPKGPYNLRSKNQKT